MPNKCVRTIRTSTKSILCLNSLMNTMYMSNVLSYSTLAFDAIIVWQLASSFVISFISLDIFNNYLRYRQVNCTELYQNILTTFNYCYIAIQSVCLYICLYQFLFLLFKTNISNSFSVYFFFRNLRKGDQFVYSLTSLTVKNN